MTPSEKKFAAQALRAGLSRLWDGRGEAPRGKSAYICGTLTGAGKHTACALIMERLGGCHSAAWWLIRRVPEAGPSPTSPEVQEWRRLWMLALIKELEP